MEPPPPPPSEHSNFFSSLKQVEKRLKLQHPTTNSQTHDNNNNNNSSLASLSSPIFLHFDQPTYCNTNTTTNTQPPLAFLSPSPDFPSYINNNIDEINVVDSERCELEGGVDGSDEIERLIRLLGLLDEEDDDKEESGGSGCNSCHCEGGFYSKIVGVKGPKCGKEVKRLDGWIKYFREGHKEPLRLAHLLLGKRVFVSADGDGNDDDGFGGLEFPSTIQEFLHTDPPSFNC